MDDLMTVTANYQCFASSSCHLFHPFRFFSLPRFLQVRQLADMMDLYLLASAAEFARIRQDSFQEFAAVGHEELGEMIDQDRLLLPL
jgi:hypothetical protein